MFDLTDDQIKAAQDIIRQNPTLIWYSKAYDQLDIRSVSEAVFNFGSWEQTQQLIKILGIEKAAQIYSWHNAQKRCNLHKLSRNYYYHYFSRHVPQYSYS